MRHEPRNDDVIVCRLCDEPHEMTVPQQPRAKATKRQLEILTAYIKDPLARAHVTRVVYAAGERTWWWELTAIANRAENEVESWPQVVLDELNDFTPEGLLEHAFEEHWKLERYRRFYDRLDEHQERVRASTRFRRQPCELLCCNDSVEEDGVRSIADQVNLAHLTSSWCGVGLHDPWDRFGDYEWVQQKHDWTMRILRRTAHLPSAGGWLHR